MASSSSSRSSTIGIGPGQPLRMRAPSLIPPMEEAAVEIVSQGWLNKQGGAKGGRKSWKRRWFVLKEDCLYYKESPESLVLLGVMPLYGCHILDLGCLTQSAPPPHNDTQTVCHECKKPFSFLERKHHCRHCGNTFCSSDSSKRIAIPKFGFHSRVRVCDTCYESVATELESSEVVLKLLELTGEKPDAPSDTPALKTSIAAHAQAMEQLKHRAALEKASAPEKRASVIRGVGQEEKKRFTLPSVNKPHLFALKNSERELWLHAENTETRLEWVKAIRNIQKRKVPQTMRGGLPNDAKPDAPSWEIEYSAVSVLNKVGVGAFGEVYRARLWGTEVACKTLKVEQFKNSAALLEDLKKEVSILSQLRHPNVVLYIGACTIQPNVCILTEWCSRGSLYDVLHDYTVYLPAKLTIDIAMGIAQGINYLHSLEKKIIHRDLKSHNILVNKVFGVKVADFGLSHVREHAKSGASAPKPAASGSSATGELETVVHKGPRHYGIFGTPEWMAPEVMEGNVYSEKIDVYSFGVLLSELVTRQMPFHDQYKIACYMDVVDAVLDQGAIPTIPKWCENLLGGLIRACVSRVPSERPNFTDIILRLREVADLDDSLYFFAFDLPRLRELMMSNNPGIQSLAAGEVAALLDSAHIRRRSTPSDAMGSPTPGDVASPSSASSPFLQSSSPLSGLQTFSPSNSGVSNLGGLGSPLAAGPGARQPHIEGDYWILSNEDAFDFLERFTQLLSSSHREVQLHSCRALHSLLRLSSQDRAKRAQDRELIIQCGGFGSLLALLLSEQAVLSSAAGQVLLLLSEDLSPTEQGAFVGLNTVGLAQLHTIVGQDIADDERALAEIQSRIERKRDVLAVVAACVKEAPSHSSPASLLKKPRPGNKRSGSMTPIKFVGVGVGSPLFGHAVPEGAEGDDSDDDLAISAQLLAAAAAATIKRQAPGDDDWDAAGGRGRAETAKPMAAGSSAMPSMALANAGDPTNPVLLPLFMKLGELLSSNAPVPERFTDWYSNIVHAFYTLRYEVEGASWHICFAILLPDELRLFHDTRDEPDEPLFIIRTRMPDPDSDDGAFIHAKVRVGHKHGMPFCFQVDDCGRIFTLCSGNAQQQEMWRAGITGKPAGQQETPMAGQGGTVFFKAENESGAHPLPVLGLSLSTGVAPGVAAAAVTSPLGGAAEDPTQGKDIPHLELPTPPFAKRYREITFHGYLMIRDRITSAWCLKYALLVGTTLRVFDSHRSSPQDPWAEHEIDPEFTNVNASERRTRPGVNEFFIRLHSSSVQFDCWAANAEDKAKWLQALIGDRASPQLAGTQSLSATGISSMSSTSSSSTSSVGASRIAAFTAYYGHLDYYGYLYRRRKLTNRWLREWVVLVDSEVHYYSSAASPVDQPSGTFYIATHSGRAFHIKQSSKRSHTIGIINPSRTYYLAAETEKEYLCWVNAILSAQKNAARRTHHLVDERQKLQAERTARASISAMGRT